MTGRFWLAVSWLRERVVEGLNEFATMWVVVGLSMILGLFLAGVAIRIGWFG